VRTQIGPFAITTISLETDCRKLGTNMSFAQVHSIVTCAVVAVVGCGIDRQEPISERVAATSVARCTGVRLLSPSNAAALPIDRPIALGAEPVCPSGVTGEVQFWVRPDGTSSWTVLPDFTAGQAHWIAPSIGSWRVTAVARAVGSSAAYDARATSSLSIRVTPTGAPHAVNDVMPVTMSRPAMLDLIANDRDPTGGGLTVTGVTQGAHGSVSLTGTVATYVPSPGYSGADRFQYTITNSTGYPSTASALVAVQSVIPVCTITIEATGGVIGAPVQLTAHTTCNGGTPEIQWSHQPPDSGFVVFQPYSEATTAAFDTTGQITGVHQFAARVRVKGTTKPTYGSNTLDVALNNDVTPCTAVAMTRPTTGSVFAIDQAIAMQAVATCPDGVSPEYQFWVRLLGSQDWTILPDYVTGTEDFTPPQPGDWELSASARAIGSQLAFQVRSESVVVTVSAAPTPVDDVLRVDEDHTGSVNVLANDVDPNGDALTAAIVSGPTSGSASITDGVVSYTPASNYNGNDVIRYAVDDGHGNTATATLRITVDPVNDDPVAIQDALAVAEDTGGSLDVAANDQDIDGDALTVIAVTQPAHGSAAFSGSVVSYLPGPDFNGDDAFDYTISDGHGGQASATVFVSVSAVNDAPTASDDDLTVAEDGEGAIYLLANDRDPDGETPSVVGFDPPSHGSVSVTAGFASYHPARDYNGPDAFSYTIQDAAGASSTATVHIVVLPVNDPPVAVADSAMLDEDTSAAIDVVGNDSDVDGDALAIASLTAPAHGSAVIVDGHHILYTPAANYHGSDSFSYTVADPSGATATAAVALEIASINDPPIAAGDSASLDEDTSATIDVTGNDGDVDGDALTIVAVTQPEHGSAEIVDAGRVAYTPAADYHGPDGFSYTIDDGNGGRASATVAIAVASVNDAPIAADDTAITDEDTALVIDLVGNDSDVDGDALAIASLTQPAHGVAEIVDPHRVRYTPAADYSGGDSFRYTIEDGNGGEATATVAIAIAPVNDPPIARADLASVLEDGSVAIDLVANDSDVDGDPLAIAAITQPAHGSAALADGRHVIYTPAANYHGGDGFSYTVVDPSGAAASAAVAIDVVSVNDPPQANPDAASLDEDGAVTVDVVANDFDIDGDELAIAVITQPAHGLATIVDGHRVLYVPAPDYHGPDALSYTISDGNGGQASAELALAVASVNDAPIARDDVASLDEDSAVTIDVVANDSDVDGDRIALAAVTQPAHGTALIVDDRHVLYTPAANYHGPDSLGYTVSDGNGGEASAALAIAVNSVNDAPVAVADAADLLEDGALTIDVVANDSDVDGDPLSVTQLTQPTHGSAAIVDGHRVSYTPAANYNGSDGFSYTISDGNGGEASAAVTLSVAAVNDAPVAPGVAAGTFDDTAVSVALAASDADGDPLSFALIATPGHGTLSPLVGNRVIYTPAPGFVGSDSFTYTASDGVASSEVATAAITVTRSVCGNGAREGREECDDGNANPGDGCEASCKLTCGSGTGADRSTVDLVSGHCFAAYDAVHHSYQETAALCAGFGGHLPTITSASEDAAAFSAVRTGDQPWLGGDDIAATGSFTWTTGEPFASYANFHAGQPDPTPGAHCLQYLSDGTWVNTSCQGQTSASGALCELEVATATPAFATGGASPRGIAVGDFNGDGYPDLAAVNQGANTVGILRGNGAGGYVLQGSFATGNGPVAVGAGDFDRDGRLDLAVVNAAASTVGILRGTASGGFTAGATVSIASGATSIAVGDFDQDGILDLVVGASGTVQVLRGNGSGGFASLTSLAITGAAAAIGLGDFDRDGKLDLAVTTPAAILVVLSTGGGLLGLPVTVALSTNNRALSIADLDGDGNLDLAVVNGAASVTLWFGSPTGAFTASTTLTAPGTPQLVALGDFDGDGARDVVALNPSYATLFHGAGRAFTAGLSVATGGGGASFAVAANLNGDAVQDLVVANTTTATAGVLLGGSGGLSGARALVAGTAIASTVSADFNEDGLPDLAVVDSAAGKVTVYLQTTGGALVAAGSVTISAGAGSGFAVAGDFNGDHHLDLAISNASFNSVSVANGTGTGTFAAPINVGTAQSPRRLAVGDFNSDGKLDIAVAAATGGAVTLLINNGTGRFGHGPDLAITGTPVAVVVGDFNGDHNADLAVATTGEASVKLLIGHGNNTFNPPVALAVASPGQSIATADLDGDGKLDLIATNTTGNSVSVLRGSGDGTFGPASNFAVGAQPTAVVAADLDGDARLDLVVTSAGTSDLTVLHNDGAGGLFPYTVRLGVAPSWLTVADFDHDGHVDIAVSALTPFVAILLSPR
jgi:cysteine-rich repeat protein